MENYSMAPKVLNLLKFDFYCLRILYLGPIFYLLVFWSLHVEGGERKSLEKEKKEIKCSVVHIPTMKMINPSINEFFMEWFYEGGLELSSCRKKHIQSRRVFFN